MIVLVSVMDHLDLMDFDESYFSEHALLDNMSYSVR